MQQQTAYRVWFAQWLWVLLIRVQGLTLVVFSEQTTTDWHQWVRMQLILLGYFVETETCLADMMPSSESYFTSFSYLYMLAYYWFDTNPPVSWAILLVFFARELAHFVSCSCWQQRPRCPSFALKHGSELLVLGMSLNSLSADDQKCHCRCCFLLEAGRWVGWLLKSVWWQIEHQSWFLDC